MEWGEAWRDRDVELLNHTMSLIKYDQLNQLITQLYSTEFFIELGLPH